MNFFEATGITDLDFIIWDFARMRTATEIELDIAVECAQDKAIEKALEAWGNFNELMDIIGHFTEFEQEEDMVMETMNDLLQLWDTMADVAQLEIES